MVPGSQEPRPLQDRSVQRLTAGPGPGSQHRGVVPSRADRIVEIVRHETGVADGFVPLHAPVFSGREGEYVQDTIRSTFVSSVGAYVDRIERMLCEVTGAEHAVATVNGTTALQVALYLVGVKAADLVLTQSLSFAGTANAIAHAGAEPVFLDVERDSLGLDPDCLSEFLNQACERTTDGVRHRATGRKIAACVPMHSFGHPLQIEAMVSICADWDIPLVEDAAEALGSTREGRGCGTFGTLGILSFNGNKVVTTGGGGAIVTDDPVLARRAKHLTTTAKVPHRWRFYHDEVAWNYRMPNLNAALGCAQLERLSEFLGYKRDLAARYQARFASEGICFHAEPAGTRSNYWLCAILLNDRDERDGVLAVTNDAGIMTRPIWEPLHKLPGFAHCLRGELPVTLEIADRLINIPSSFRDP